MRNALALVGLAATVLGATACGSSSAYSPRYGGYYGQPVAVQQQVMYQQPAQVVYQQQQPTVVYQQPQVYQQQPVYQYEQPVVLQQAPSTYYYQPTGYYRRPAYWGGARIWIR